MFRYQRKHYLLLEVLIAFTLIIFCLVPLIQPHVLMLKAQRSFIQKIEVDHLVNLLYAHIYEKLLKNEIPWQSIQAKTVFSVDEALLREVNYLKPLPYVGSYQFQEIKHKPKTTDPTFTLYLLRLTFTFLPNELVSRGNLTLEEIKKNSYEYQIFVSRQLKS